MSRRRSRLKPGNAERVAVGEAAAKERTHCNTEQSKLLHMRDIKPQAPPSGAEDDFPPSKHFNNCYYNNIIFNTHDCACIGAMSVK